jgi:PAS domain S-box-containing protein
MDWFTDLFSGNGFMPRRVCGDWTTELMLLHIISDTGIWLAYMSIPAIMAYFIRRKKDMPFPHVFWMFVAFIVFCGFTHLVDVMMFFHPAYRFAGVLKAATAIVSLATVYAIWRVMPAALLIKNPKELEQEVEARTGELARANQRFRALLNCTTDAVWTRDPQGNFSSRQDSWEKFTGQTWDQYKDGGWFNAIHPDDRDAVLSNWHHCFATLSEHRILKRVWHAETQTYRFCEGRAVPVFDNNDELIEWVGMLADIHDRVTAERKLKEQTAALTMEAAAKDNFMAMLAHELRNPLAPIQNCVTILRNDKDSEILAWAQDTIERQVQHMARLVDDLLDVSRMMRGKVELKLSDTDMTTVLFRAIETVKPLIEGQHHKFILALPNGPIVRFHADEVRLAQVVSNLLSNAAKYTPEKGTICLTGETDDGKLVIKVRDNGIGITGEQQEEDL